MKRKGSNLFLAMVPVPCSCSSDVRIAAEPARMGKRRTRTTTTQRDGRLPTIEEEPISMANHRAEDGETQRRVLSMSDHRSAAAKVKMVENGKEQKTAAVTRRESRAAGMEDSYVHLMLEVASKVSSGGFGRCIIENPLQLSFFADDSRNPITLPFTFFIQRLVDFFSVDMPSSSSFVSLW
ncbi:hypothetical protein ACLOJK_022235 [Asimina triloba]